MQSPVQAQTTLQIRIPHGYIWENPNINVPSADEAANLESQLAADPEKEDVRSKLLSYYSQQGMREQRNDSIYWLIEHHPESRLHQYQRAAFVSDSARGTGGVFITPDDYQRAVQLWQLQALKHPDDPMVLSNASRIFAPFGRRRGSTSAETRARARSKTLFRSTGGSLLDDPDVLRYRNERTVLHSCASD
jgi:hypothetical protein